jgi:hypothetical protein
LLDQLTSYQLSEWEAYDRLDPIGTWREDFRVAELLSLITNTARAVHGKKGIKMSSPSDFMPNWDALASGIPQVKKQSAEEMKQILLSMASTHNRKVKNKMEPTNTTKK